MARRTSTRTASPYARRAIGCLVDLQREMGGSALIGRELYPLVTGASYRDVRVSPRMRTGLTLFRGSRG